MLFFLFYFANFARPLVSPSHSAPPSPVSLSTHSVARSPHRALSSLLARLSAHLAHTDPRAASLAPASSSPPVVFTRGVSVCVCVCLSRITSKAAALLPLDLALGARPGAGCGACADEPTAAVPSEAGSKTASLPRSMSRATGQARGRCRGCPPGAEGHWGPLTEPSDQVASPPYTLQGLPLVLAGGSKILLWPRRPRRVWPAHSPALALHAVPSHSGPRHVSFPFLR